MSVCSWNQLGKDAVNLWATWAYDPKLSLNQDPKSHPACPCYDHTLGFTSFSLYQLPLPLSTPFHESAFVCFTYTMPYLLDAVIRREDVRYSVGCGWRRNSLSARHTGLCRTANDTVFDRKPGNRHTSTFEVGVVKLCCIIKFRPMGKWLNTLTKISQAWD